MSTVGHTQFELWTEMAAQPRYPASYHVRAHTTLPEVLAGEARAKKQEERVLATMRACAEWPRPILRFTPWEIAAALGLPITSARRALTNLTNAGLLRHYPADRRVSGPYGAKSATWGLAK